MEVFLGPPRAEFQFYDFLSEMFKNEKKTRNSGAPRLSPQPFPLQFYEIGRLNLKDSIDKCVEPFGVPLLIGLDPEAFLNYAKKVLRKRCFGGSKKRRKLWDGRSFISRL